MRVLRLLPWAILLVGAAPILGPARIAAAQAPVELGARPSALVSSWLRYRIEAGRVVTWSGGLGPKGIMASNLSHTQVNQTATRNERLTLEIKSGTPNVHYELHVPGEDLLIEIHAWNQLSANRTSRTPAIPSFSFEQPAEGEIVLTLGSGSEERVARADNLWQLLIVEPALCRQTILPLLGSMRADWRLSTQIAEIEDELFRIAANSRPDDHRQWQAWIDELSNDRFGRRSVAQRHLLQVGPTIGPFLEQLDQHSLEPEQRERVRQILLTLGRSVEDTPERAAARLASDPRVWASLAQRSDVPRRRLAADQIAVCLERPVDFDPVAEPEKRSEQLAKLREEIAAAAARNRETANANSSTSKSPEEPTADDE